MLVEVYLANVSEEQKRNGTPVLQAAPMLAHRLEALVDHVPMRAQLSQSVWERISLARDIASFSLAFYTMRRGFDFVLHPRLPGFAAARFGGDDV